MRTVLAVAFAALILLSACAAPDGSRPRLSPVPGETAGPSSFNGGYAGTNGGFSNLNAKTVPF